MPQSPARHRCPPAAPAARPRRFALALIGLVALFAAQLALAPVAAAADAPAWPSRPISLLISYPPGAITDTVGRRVGERLSAALGVPVVIDNRGGAGGNVAAGAVARAQPDGYTLLFTSYGNLIIAAAANLKLDFHPERDLTAVAMVGPMTVVMLVRPALPTRTIQEFVGYAKANPGKVNFASVGIGSSYHLLIEQLIAFGGLKMVHVPYKGGAASMVDFLGGRVDAMLATWLFAKPYVSDNRARAVAVVNAERSPVLANLPTVGEQAVPGARLVDGLCLMAPAKLPAPILARLNTEMRRIIEQPEMHAWLTDNGVPPTPMSPEAFAALLHNEAEPLGKLIRENNIRLE